MARHGGHWSMDAPGMALDVHDICNDFSRFLIGRKPGTTGIPPAQSRMRSKFHRVFEGKTTRFIVPIGLLILRIPDRSPRMYRIKDTSVRPCRHTYHHKYGVRDYRGGRSASRRVKRHALAAGLRAK